MINKSTILFAMFVSMSKHCAIAELVPIGDVLIVPDDEFKFEDYKKMSKLPLFDDVYDIPASCLIITHTPQIFPQFITHHIIAPIFDIIPRCNDPTRYTNVSFTTIKPYIAFKKSSALLGFFHNK